MKSSKQCPHCSNLLTYKYAHYVDYLLCEYCGEKFTESKFRLGTRSFEETEKLTISYYTQPTPVFKTIIYIAGANIHGGNQSKKALNQSRIYKLSDEYKFNVICVGVKSTYFQDQVDYSILFNFIMSKNKLNEKDVILVGFSNGGIPTISTSWKFKFHKVCLISPVLSVLTNIFCEKVQSDVVLVNNLKDSSYFLNSIAFLKTGLLKNNKSYCILNVNAGHTTTKSFEQIVEHCF